MEYNYDKYYKEEKYFGKPYRGLIEFFRSCKTKGKVLDLGCGQGRDSIALAKLGYTVVGVDHSKVGIEQMMEEAAHNGLDIEGTAADIYEYKITSDYDIVLMDSMLHFYKGDIEKETALTNRILDELKPNGILCNCMQKGKSRETLYKKIIDTHKNKFEIMYNDYIDYPEANATYHMYVIKKQHSSPGPMC